MKLYHFYPNTTQLHTRLRQRVEQSVAAGLVDYMPWINSALQLAGRKPYGPPYIIKPADDIRLAMIDRGFINENGTPASPIGYLDLESPSKFWRPDLGAYQEFTHAEHVRVYQDVRTRAQAIAPRVKIGFFAATEAPAHWGAVAPPVYADRIQVIHGRSSAIFCSCYFYDQSADPEERLQRNMDAALRGLDWHATARAHPDVPLIAFVWARWKDPPHNTRQLMPLRLWDRWLDELANVSALDGICWFGGGTEAEAAHWDVFTNLAG